LFGAAGSLFDITLLVSVDSIGFFLSVWGYMPMRIVVALSIIQAYALVSSCTIALIWHVPLLLIRAGALVASWLMAMPII
jgi:hypothetical protein